MRELQRSVKKSGTANSFAVLPLPLDASSRDDDSTSSNTAVASSITSANGGVLLQGAGAVILRGVQVAVVEGIAIQGGAVSITGAAINTPGTLTFNADKLILGIQTTQIDTSNTGQGADAAWIKNKGEGSTTRRRTTTSSTSARWSCRSRACKSG